MKRRQRDTKGFTTTLTTEQFNHRVRGKCPACGGKIVKKAHHRTDVEGTRHFAGAFWGCANFGRTCDAGYTLGFDMKRGVPTEYRYHDV